MGIPAGPGVAASGLPPAGDQASAVLSGQITAVGPTAPFAFRGPANLALFASVNSALTTTAGSLAATVASATGLAPGSAINSINVPPGATVGALSGTNVTLALPPINMTGIINTQQRQISGLLSTSGLSGAAVTNARLPAGTTVTGILLAAVPPTNTSPGTPGIVSISNLPLSAPVGGEAIAQQFSFARNGNAIVTTGADATAIFTGAGVTFTGSIQLERSFDGCNTFALCNIGGGGQLAIYTAGTPISLTFGEPEKQVFYRLNCTVLSGGNINYRISETGGANEALAIGPLTNG